MERSEKLLSREHSVLVLVDLQDTFLNPIKVASQIVANVRLLLQVSRQLGVPCLATTHNAEKLGGMTPQLASKLGDIPVLNKLTFSGLGNEEFVRHLQATGRTQVVLVGIETHICVMQTALDLLKAGYSVHVPHDAVASREKRDWKYALLRLAHAGATITSIESVIYEWLYEAGTDEFRQVLPLLKAREQARLQEEEEETPSETEEPEDAEDDEETEEETTDETDSEE